MRLQRNRQKGVYLVMAAFIMIVLLAFAMLTIDTMVISLAKAQLYTAADAAALAAVSHLVGPYDASKGENAREDAKRFAAANGIEIEDDHVTVGRFAVPVATVTSLGTRTYGGQSYPNCFKYQIESGLPYQADLITTCSAERYQFGNPLRVRDCSVTGNNGTFTIRENNIGSLYFVLQQGDESEGANETSSPGELCIFVNTTQGEPDSIEVIAPRNEDGDGSRQTVKLLIGPFFGIYEVSLTIPVVATQPRRAVMFVMDRSGSMNDNTELDPDRSGYKVISNKGVTTNQSHDNDWITFAQRNGTTTSPIVPINPITFTGDKWVRVRYENSGGYRRATTNSPTNTSGFSRSQYWYNNSTMSGGGFSMSSADTDWTRKFSAGSYWTWGYNTGTYSSSRTSRGYYHTMSYCDHQLPIYDTQVAAVSFVERLDETRDSAGLVTYAASDTLDEDLDLLSSNKATIESDLMAYSASGMTAVEDGMETAYDQLKNQASSVQKVMILLTDGLANQRHGSGYTVYDSMQPTSWPTRTIEGVSGKYPFDQPIINGIIQDAYLCRDKGIRVYTVAFHFLRGSPEFDAGDFYLLPRVSDITQGTHHNVWDSSTMTDVFQEIFEQLPPLLSD